jgi:hypothetical protein
MRTKKERKTMKIQEIYNKFKTLKTSSEKLVFLDELKNMTKNNIIKFDIKFDTIEESIMNER